MHKQAFDTWSTNCSASRTASRSESPSMSSTSCSRAAMGASSGSRPRLPSSSRTSSICGAQRKRLALMTGGRHNPARGALVQAPACPAPPVFPQSAGALPTACGDNGLNVRHKQSYRALSMRSAGRSHLPSSADTPHSAGVSTCQQARLHQSWFWQPSVSRCFSQAWCACGAEDRTIS